MRRTLCILCSLFLLWTTGFTQGAGGGGAAGGNGTVTTDTGKKGAKNGCYADGTARVNMNAAGKTTGDMDVTISDQDGNSATGLGTAAQDGGVWESEEVTVGGTRYRVEGGKVQRQNSDGSWQGMDRKADKHCEDTGGDAPFVGGDGTIGTLPDDDAGVWPFVYLHNEFPPDQYDWDKHGPIPIGRMTA